MSQLAAPELPHSPQADAQNGRSAPSDEWQQQPPLKKHKDAESDDHQSQPMQQSDAEMQHSDFGAADDSQQYTETPGQQQNTATGDQLSHGVYMQNQLPQPMQPPAGMVMALPSDIPHYGVASSNGNSAGSGVMAGAGAHSYYGQNQQAQLPHQSQQQFSYGTADTNSARTYGIVTAVSQTQDSNSFVSYDNTGTVGSPSSYNYGVTGQQQQQHQHQHQQSQEPQQHTGESQQDQTYHEPSQEQSSQQHHVWAAHGQGVMYQNQQYVDSGHDEQQQQQHQQQQEQQSQDQQQQSQDQQQQQQQQQYLPKPIVDPSQSPGAVVVANFFSGSPAAVGLLSGTMPTTELSLGPIGASPPAVPLFSPFQSSIFGPTPAEVSLASQGIRGIPSIHTACIDGNLRAVMALVRSQREGVESRDIVGSRPLHVASCYGHVDVMRFLIEEGAFLDALDNYNSPPVVVTTHAEAVELLVSFGAQIDIKNANSVSARSLSHTNPYVYQAIEKGLKTLMLRKEYIRHYLRELSSPGKAHMSEEAGHISALHSISDLSSPQLTPMMTNSALSPVTGPMQLRTKSEHGGNGEFSIGRSAKEMTGDSDGAGLPLTVVNHVLEYLFPDAQHLHSGGKPSEQLSCFA